MPHPTLRAFESRNYRLYFAGQLVSLIGSWMTTTASLWLVYHLSQSPWMLGVVGFSSQAPSFLLAPLAGVWVDRLNRYHLLLATQFLSMLQSFALAFFALTGTIDIPHLIGLNIFQGLINAFDLPARQTMVIELAEKKENLSNAIALNSSMFNLSRLVGPALAGFVIAGFGAGICFLIDGVSYLAVLGSLLAMRIQPRARATTTVSPWNQLREGFTYAMGFVPIRALIVLVAVVSFWGFSFSVLAPVFAKETFHGDARTLGLLMTSAGGGALLGALYLSTRRKVRGLGHVIVLGGLMQGGGLLAFSAMTWLPAAMGCLVVTGAGGILMIASCNTLVQTLVEDDKRGRVMSLFTMAFQGTMPLGNLAMGWLAAKIGAAATIGVCGSGSILAALVFCRYLPILRLLAKPVMDEREPLNPPVDLA